MKLQSTFKPTGAQRTAEEHGKGLRSKSHENGGPYVMDLLLAGRPSRRLAEPERRGPEMKWLQAGTHRTLLIAEQTSAW